MVLAAKSHYTLIGRVVAIADADTLTSPRASPPWEWRREKRRAQKSP
jgi:hypothetical protein